MNIFSGEYRRAFYTGPGNDAGKSVSWFGRYRKVARWLLTAAFSLAVTPALASSFLCELKDHTGNHGIPPVVFLDIDKKAGLAVVYDGFIKQVYNAPLNVPFKKVADHRYEISWRVENIPVRNGFNRALVAVMRFDEAAMRATIITYLVGWDNEDTGSGPCKRFEPKKK